MRMTRTMMLEVLRQDYVRTAWAKGLEERKVVLRHAVKNALIPVVTLVGLQLPIIAGGSVIIENIFNLPGLGRLMLNALNLRDYPVVSGVNLFFASVVVLINLATDLRTPTWIRGSAMSEPLPDEARGAPVRDAPANARRPVADFFRRLLRQQPLGAAAGAILLGLVFVAIFAEQLTPHEYDIGRVQDRLQAPSAEHLLGTDHAGRDVLARILKGAQVSLLVGLTATVLNTIVALLVGGTTGFIGGRVDIYTQRFVDAWMSFPGLLLLLTIMSFVDRSIVTVVVVLGVTGGIPASRVVRGAVIGVKENAYFQAAQATGARRPWILVRHVLPNIAAPLIVIFSINVGGVIIAEASLSFLGFGLPVNVPSWGGMLSREGRRYMELAPRLALWPGLFLTVTVYCLNMVGDAVRDLLDPRLRGQMGRLGGAKLDQRSRRGPRPG